MSEVAAIIDFCNAVEAACVNLRLKLGDKPTEKKATAAVNETTFTQLKWELHEGPKMGEFEIATAENNDAYKFADATKILQTSNADIKTRYHGENYTYAYWLYEGKIFRKKLEPKT
jgi:hypothetical protein